MKDMGWLMMKIDYTVTVVKEGIAYPTIWAYTRKGKILLFKRKLSIRDCVIYIKAVYDPQLMTWENAK